MRSRNGVAMWANHCVNRHYASVLYMHKLISKHNSALINTIVERRYIGSESLCHLGKLFWLRVKKLDLKFVFLVPNPIPLYSILLTFSSVSGLEEPWNEETGMGQQKQNILGMKESSTPTERHPNLFPPKATSSPQGSLGSGPPVKARKQLDAVGGSSGSEDRGTGWSRHSFVKWEWTIRNRRQFSFERLSHSQWEWWKTLLPCLLGDFNMARLWNLILYWILYWMWWCDIEL